MSDRRLKKWAQARMTPESWNRIGNAMGATGRGIHRAASEVRHWADIGSDTVTSFRQVRLDPWRLLFAVMIVLMPTTILRLLPISIPVGVLIALLLGLVMVGTYAGDWLGGVTSAITGLVALDMFFLGQQAVFDFWHHAPQTWIVIFYLAAAGAMITLFEHVKHELALARMELSAQRAANTAFYAVEIAAAQRPAGDSNAYLEVLQMILTAMVRSNRASTGAIYLVDSPNRTLLRAATYGEDSLDPLPGDEANNTVPIDYGFVGRVASERRPVVLSNITADDNAPDVWATNPHVRSAVGVPIFTTSNELSGVAWVGLYVPYKFTQTTQARLQALAYRMVAFMDAARAADAQVEELGRVQSSHRRLQSVIQTMPEAVMVIRPPDGTIVTSNAAAQRLFDISPTALRPRRIDQLNITPDPPEAEVELPTVIAMRDGTVATSVELLVHTWDGREVPVVGSAAPLITDESGEIDAVVAVFQDVSPLKEAERLRDEFISVVSHELRSPLTPIRGFAQVISRDLEREGGHEQHIKWLNTLQMHTDRLTRLVDDLLDVSRMRAGRLSVLHEDVDVVEIATAVVESKRTTQATHSIELDTNLTTLPALMDRDRMVQVLDNLISNAVKYTEHGTITVGVDADASMIRLSVSDEGRGIPAEHRENLFSAFYRTRDANESAVPGLGLGLYIVRELVRAHDGEIRVEEAASGGAKFVIELPRMSPLTDDTDASEL